jgi:PAS domain S-box-containing protein
MILITGLNFSSLQSASQNLTEEKIQASSELFVELIKVPLIIYDLATIDDAVKSFSKIKNIVAVEVSDAQNNTVSEFLEKDTLPVNIFHDLKQSDNFFEYDNNIFSLHTVNIIAENENIGHVHFAFDITGTSKSIKKNKNYSFLLIALSLIIGLLIAYLIGNGLENSLKRLALIAQAVSNDKPVDIPFDPKKNDEMGKLFTAMHTMQEHITERTKRLNESLHEYQQFFQAIETTDIVSKADIHGNITYVNDKFVQVSGYSRKELLGQNHRIIKHPDMDRKIFDKLWKTISAKHVFQATIQNRKKNGEAYFVDSTIIPLLDNENNIIEYLAIRHEVTELVETRNKALSAEKAKSEFLSNMSHEIRTPMNAVLGFVQILQKIEDNKKKLSYLDLIAGSSQTLLSVINEILDLSKIESGKLHIENHPFNPLIELSHASKSFMVSANDKSIRFLTYIDPNMPQCMYGDIIRIKQIMFNFLSNAFKFTAEDKTIRVNITYEDKLLSISVADEGIGLEPEALKKIFNAFEQADTSTTRKYGGTGLGLTISKKLSELMNGNISVESVYGKGSTFTLSLPVQICTARAENLIVVDESALTTSYALLYSKESDKESLDLINRYLNDLKFSQVNTMTSLSECDVDVIIFVPDKTINEAIIKSEKPALALIPFENELFTDDKQIHLLTAPYTSVDLVTVLNIISQDKAAIEVQEIVPTNKAYKGHILVAEDNVTNQLLIKLILDDYGIQYTIANDGIEAVDAFKDTTFDLVLMDENMPNMTGVQAVEKIREYEFDNEKQPTPIIALTANVLKEDRERFRKAGMNDFLAKPIDTDKLENILSRFLLS